MVVVSPTLNVTPILFVIPCKFLEYDRYRVVQLLSLTKSFFIQTSIIDEIFHYKLLHGKVGFCPINELISFTKVLVSLIHKSCHLKSHLSDIKYHMTLNIIFSEPSQES